MNTTSTGTNWLSGIGSFVNNLATGAGKIISGLNAPSATQAASTQAQATAAQAATQAWLTPVLWIGGALLAVVIVVLAVRK